MPSRWCVDHSIQSLIIAELPQQLNDIIQGLMYLHSQDIVHGDLCGVSVFCVVNCVLIPIFSETYSLTKSELVSWISDWPPSSNWIPPFKPRLARAPHAGWLQNCFFQMYTTLDVPSGKHLLPMCGHLAVSVVRFAHSCCLRSMMTEVLLRSGLKATFPSLTCLTEA